MPRTLLVIKQDRPAARSQAIEAALERHHAVPGATVQHDDRSQVARCVPDEAGEEHIVPNFGARCSVDAVGAARQVAKRHAVVNAECDAKVSCQSHENQQNTLEGADATAVVGVLTAENASERSVMILGQYKSWLRFWDLNR